MEAADLKSKVDFNFIRYANCWEDADVLLQGLEASPGDLILSIGSAGDNSLSLLTANPGKVIAVDVNPVQLYLIELKKACFMQLEHNELLEFLGFNPSERRKELFSQVKNHLGKETKVYWESNFHAIEMGVIFQGKFEKYFSFFHRRVLPLIHSSKTIQRLFEEKPGNEQAMFYFKEWNNWRWKLFFRIFFNRYVMGKYGRDPEFMKEVNIPVSQFIFNKAEKHLQSIQAQQNYFLKFIHTGTFGNEIPHYARKENFESIRQNIEKLEVLEGFAEDALKQYNEFNCMNLSNIFEYMDRETFRATAEKLISESTRGAKIGYWNLMVPRSISQEFPQKALYKKELSENLCSRDKGFFYHKFIIDEII